MTISKWIEESDKIDSQKKEIIAYDGNTFVTANPGTGKTQLLIYKYLNLIENGYTTDDILCLTFTAKARNDLERKLIETITVNDLKIDKSKIKIYTFHSFALDESEEKRIVSSNFLRYIIYKYFKKNEVFNYSNEYLLDTIVPKMENLLRYLKSYNVLPKDIKLNEVKLLLEETDSITKEQIDTFAEHFVRVYKYYEEQKTGMGIDYSDMLLNFLNKKKVPTFKYVLVDEMQDVNQLEAKIALMCAEKFVCVGDKKQAIMGFQGGSVSNLELFKDSKNFILDNNFRSKQEILDYAKASFKSIDPSNIEELKNLRNANGEHGEKTTVYSVEKDSKYSSACEIAKELSKTNKTVAIIVRTNSQIEKVTKQLIAKGIEFSSTYFSASTTAKNEIISFLKGILSDDPIDMKNALFSPFFPIDLQDAFYYSKLSNYKLLKECKELEKLRLKIQNLRDIEKLFENYILPVSVEYGSGYLLAATSIQSAYIEALDFLKEINYNSLIDFISAANFEAQSVEAKNKIVVTTVHKAKGIEYDSVVYIPQKTKENENFQDKVVQAILLSKGVDVKEELLEESLRIDFVAFTRPMKSLYIVTDKPDNYLNDTAIKKDYQSTEESFSDSFENVKRAFNLFLNKDYEEAKKSLEKKEDWITKFIISHFEDLDHISFSRLNGKPEDYLRQNILKLGFTSDSLELGSEVHSYAESLLKGEIPEVKEEYKVYFENLKKLIEEIKEEYPNIESVEESFTYTLNELFGIDSSLGFSGKLDAVFSNGDKYLIVDWKTSRNEQQGAEYRQQLLSYKKALSKMKDVPEEKIDVAIGYVALRPSINTGITEKKLDSKKPAKSSIDTLIKRIDKILEWRKNPQKFIEDLLSLKISDDKLLIAICEQIKKEAI